MERNRIPVDPIAPGMVCGTCGYGLETYELWENGKLTSSRYEHGYLPPEIDRSHEIKPILRDTLKESEILGFCDFCLAPNPPWTYPCGSYHVAIGTKNITGGTATESYGSVGDWGACDACHDDIEADCWGNVLERNLRSDPERMVEPLRTLLSIKIREMWRDFERSRTGPAYRG